MQERLFYLGAVVYWVVSKAGGSSIGFAGTSVVSKAGGSSIGFAATCGVSTLERT